MKHGLMSMFLIATLWGCAETDISPTASNTSEKVPVVVTRKDKNKITQLEKDVCEGATTVDLVTSNGERVGEITVSNSANEIFITATSDDSWEIGESHLHFGRSLEEFPLNKPGNPKVGHFDHKNEGELTTGINFKVELSDLVDPTALAVQPGEIELFVSFHANVLGTAFKESDESEFYESEFDDLHFEGAWSKGEAFGKSWAMYFVHNIQLCD